MALGNNTDNVLEIYEEATTFINSSHWQVLQNGINAQTGNNTDEFLRLQEGRIVGGGDHWAYN